MVDPDQWPPTYLVAISKDGLSVELDGERRFVSCDAVSSVSG